MSMFGLKNKRHKDFKEEDSKSSFAVTKNSLLTSKLQVRLYSKGI